MATRRRSAPASRQRASRRAAARPAPAVAFRLAPGTARSLVGLVLLVTGAITFIALLFPAGGILNRYVSDVLRPVFGQGAWLLAVLLLVAGIFVERAPSVGNGWGVSAVGGVVLLAGGLGIIHLVTGGGGDRSALSTGGGALGHLLGTGLAALVSPAGAVVVLVGLVVAGMLLLFNLTLRGLFRPVASSGRLLANAASSISAPVRGSSIGAAGSRQADAPTRGASSEAGRGARRSRAPVEEMPDSEPEAGSPDLPAPLPSPAPVSQTVWSGGGTVESAVPGPTAPRRGPVSGDATGEATRDADAAVLAARDSPMPVHQRSWVLPGLHLLDVREPRAGGERLDHERNRRIIEEKLRSFQIPATVTGVNTGPVVTQYEVRPDARIKLSRIESLADDLAMALAARSIRIEAPIPGRDVVGVEIPNHTSEMVGFGELIHDAAMLEATGKLTFALGRDVSGRAYAVDLAKMPHLLIAGATGSGKSVCVNALITSILMRARPDEVRLVLVDLKRVELAAYDGLPHLLTNVVVEARDARAALTWAVNEMEGRYRALAARAERNIAAFNASPKVPPDERLPYIVIVIDELADLMMREGRKVEDPVVKLAQKARAVGIHLVLATQRPSVNVVTGLIKANVPSRIAFAMASNVDSRTVLDQPGAEDLIGRGDMLYQPADLPRPVRLQGVFVSDAEVRAVTEHWRAQSPEPEYDPELLSGGEEDEEEGSGQFGWLARLAADEMTPRAAELITQTGKASTSMLQTKLKLGFNRASRVMEELERFGVVGPQDPRNPAVPRQVYGPDNWLRGAADADLE